MPLLFDPNGFLTPYEAIPTDLANLEAVFVNDFPTSRTRRPLSNRYIEALGELQQLLKGQNVGAGFNGGFISRKLNPEDIDVLTFVGTDTFVRVENERTTLRAAHRQGPYPVDLLWIQVYPEGHHLRGDYESDYIQWFFE